MKFDVSWSGHIEVTTLARNLTKTNDEISAETNKMQNTISQLGPSIGIFEEQLNELVNDVKSAQNRGEAGINSLVQKLNQLADRIAELINKGLS